MTVVKIVTDNVDPHISILKIFIIRNIFVTKHNFGCIVQKLTIFSLLEKILMSGSVSLRAIIKMKKKIFIYAKYFVTGILYRKKANSYLYTQDRQKVQES